MIQVHLVASPVQLAGIPASPPLVAAATTNETRAAFARTRTSQRELDALAAALARVRSPHASIVLLEGGMLFRVHVGPAGPAPAERTTARAPGWRTARPGARVLVCLDEDEHARRLSDALRFVGYAADPVAGALAAAVAANKPEVVVLAGPPPAPLAGPALVLVGGEVDAPPPPPFRSRIPTPVRTARLARAIDAALS